ncbi:hypothetical protein B0H15DRAFT_781625 [Mycena belliarum]|uniref:F-box domain-containing protein n=1 Tax=Mycena belliarum TaxID=1033014 RepID=A0AAD6U1R5_9AGAR|nr:hypothetical protein B0H15DRAFT_781625 [Mycena belliae]
MSDSLFTAFPVELRVEIFLHFCEMYCPIGEATEGPLVLLQVCRSWKELALQTPQLWNSFALVIRPVHGPKKCEFLISAMKEWINRSRNLPLSFKLHYPVFDATCAKLIQTILPASARWRDVALYAPSTSLFPLWEAPANSFPSLRAFRVEAVGHCHFPLADLRFNWAQITDLDLFGIPFSTLDECLQILKGAASLKRCSMHAACILSSNDVERIVLPTLEHFQLTVYGGDNGAVLLGQPEERLLAFLCNLCTPRLISLKIGWSVRRGPLRPYYWSDCHARFVDFLRKSGDHLEALHLECLPFSTPQVLQCLQVVPRLRHVDFSLSQADREHDFIDDELLLALTQQPGCTGLLPRLQSIRLESHGDAFSNPVLLRFIASRWKYQEPHPGWLECVDLVTSNRRAQYRPRRFKDVKDGRLEVSARLKSEFTMLEAIASFLDRDTYGKLICFMNGDFPSDVRPLLVFG